MKKNINIIIIFILVIALGFMISGCTPIPNETDSNDDNQNGDNIDNVGDDDNNGNNENPYLDIINELIEAVGGIENMGDYLATLILMLENIPLENITQIVGDLVGEEYDDYVLLVEEYYDEGIAMLGLISNMLPYIDGIEAFLNANEYFGSIILERLEQVLGITKDGNTYSFTYEDDVYSVEISEDNYLITSNDTLYTVAYSQSEEKLSSTVFDTVEEKDTLTLESIVVDNDFYIQIYDIENDRLVQIKTDVERLEAQISIQSGDFTVESISNAVNNDFATLGEVFIINEGMLSEYME